MDSHLIVLGPLVRHENEVDRTNMAAALGMPSHSEQTKMMSSSDYPDWLTAEHRTGVSKDFMILLFLALSFLIILFDVVF